jgi:hypothetical protein
MSWNSQAAQIAVAMPAAAMRLSTATPAIATHRSGGFKGLTTSRGAAPLQRLDLDGFVAGANGRGSAIRRGASGYEDLGHGKHGKGTEEGRSGPRTHANRLCPPRAQLAFFPEAVSFRNWPAAGRSGEGAFASVCVGSRPKPFPWSFRVFRG